MNLQAIKQRFGIIGKSQKLERALSSATRVANTDLTVLIQGESGVGKEVFSKIIHQLSARKHNTFIAINCGAIPEGTINSELFGHEKGAFTGATSERKGYFETANGGTIFLDEISEMPLDTQSYLLRILESGEYIKVGSSKMLKSDVRIVAATNIDLESRIREGKFREDLYYRLNVLPMTIPPLRHRREDIPELVRHFLARISAEEGRTNIRGIHSETLEMLCDYDWPGNIRQLENAIFRAVVLCDGDELTHIEFPQIEMDLKDPNVSNVPSVPSIETPDRPIEKSFEYSVGADGISLLNDKNDVIMLEEAEAQIISFAVEKYGGRMSTIARKLGIGRSTLYRKLRQYGLGEFDDSTA